MSPLYLYNGKLLLKDTTLATSENCCCKKCRRDPVGTHITFSEYPSGTPITNQYSSQGIIFGGDSPFITGDGANPTSPVLSGSPTFVGSIEGTFVDPADGVTPMSMNAFSLSAGYFDSVGATTLWLYDINDVLIRAVSNSGTGIETFSIVIEPGEECVHRWRIGSSSGIEPAGFAIDNVIF